MQPGPRSVVGSMLFSNSALVVKLSAFAKGVSMGAFGLWVIATVIWHAAHGTLPSAVTMGAVGSRGTRSQHCLVRHPMALPNGRREYALRMDLHTQRRTRQPSGAARGPWCVRHGHRLAGYSRRRHHGSSCAARCIHRVAAVSCRTTAAAAVDSVSRTEVGRRQHWRVMNPLIFLGPLTLELTPRFRVLGLARLMPANGLKEKKHGD